MKVKCPVLALNGTKDLQVSTENLQAIADAVMKGGNNDIETMTFSGLNHLFESTQTGLTSEYAEGPSRFSESVLDEMAAWLQKKRIIPRT
jgi:surfactin synthase thioesterase subunit